MSAILLSDISAILKKMIRPAVEAQFPKSVIAYGLFKGQGGTYLINNEIYISARLTPNTGIKGVAEGGQLPSGKTKFFQMKAPIKYVFAGTSVSDQSLELAKTSEQALLNFNKQLISDLVDDAKVYVNKMVYGAGDGFIGKAANGDGATSTDTLVIDSPYAVRVLGPGRELTVGATNVTVSDVIGVDLTSTTVQLSAAAIWNTGDRIVVKDSDDPMGLDGLIADASGVNPIQNIDRTTNFAVNAWVDDDVESWTAFEVDTMTKLYRAAKGFGGNPRIILMSEDMYQAYVATLINVNNYRIDPTKEANRLTTGVSEGGVGFMGGEAVVKVDPDIPNGTVYGVTPEAFDWVEGSSPFDWLAGYGGEGNIFRLSNDGTATWECTLKYYYNIVCKKFRYNFAIKNKTIS